MFDHDRSSLLQQLSRRSFLGRTSLGVGSVALGSLLNPQLLPAAPATDRWTGVITQPHFPVKAKRVIYMVMAGGMSHLESFDHRPKLAELDGKPMPDSFTKGQPIAQLQGAQLKCFAPQHPFKKWGKNGQEISTVFPHLGEKAADEICIIRSLTTKAINHDPAHTFMNTGTTISGRPSMGSWLWYGLGSESENLPGFVVLISVGGGQGQPIAQRQWHSGFLASRFQGVNFRSKGDAVLYLGNPSGVTRDQQRDVVDTVQQLNRLQDDVVQDPEIATRISQYEMAFRMQASVPELLDLKDEPQDVLDLYGTKGADGSFAANCLLARRLAERGVRFIQLYHRGWDHHGGIKDGFKYSAGLVDQGVTALLLDLKRRGMLDETLLVFTSEFGRTPMAQGNGRDHHIKGYSMWMAGGGIKPGITHGSTDDLGYNAVEDVFEVHDLHATMLHLMGVDHKKLTIRFQGRDFRLTDIHGNLTRKILA